MNCCRRPDSVSYCPIIARFFLTTVLLILPVTASATMILVPTDQPTIQAGIDAAAASDTVLVEAGTYTWTNQGTPAGGAMIDLMTGVSLVGVDPEAVVIDAEGQGSVIGGMTLGTGLIANLTITGGAATSGGGIALALSSWHVENCRIVGNTATEKGGGIAILAGSGVTVSNCVIAGNTAGDYGGGIYIQACPDYSISSCTLVENGAGSGGGVYTQMITGTIANTIVAFGTSGAAVVADHPSFVPTVSCCNIYGNAGGDWVSYIALQYDAVTNVTVDPVFCYVAGSDYTLHADSPCLAQNNSSCGQVGALGQGCTGPLSCAVDPAELTFEFDALGFPIQRSFTLAHEGDWGRLTGTLSASSQEFSMSPASYSLLPGEHVDVTATFTPNEADDETETIHTGSECGDIICHTIWLEPFTDILADLDGISKGSVDWGDYDNDGDLDLLLAGSYSAYIYRNDGGVFIDIGADLPSLSEAAVAWGDHDNDGDLDVLLTGRVGINHFTILCRNDGGVFADIGADLAGVSSGSVAWGDCDNDGDLDILLTGDNGTSKVSRVLRNDPGGFVDIGVGLPGIYKGAAIWGDHDNDGDLDLAVVGNQGSGSVADVYRNNGGTFSDAGFSMYGMLYCDAAWGDYDNDGDLDLLTVGEPTSSAASVIYRNDSGNPVYTEPGLGYVYNCAVAWGDYDGDGDLDIVLAGYNSIADTDKTWLYRNVSGDFIDVGAGLPGVSFSDVAWGDYDDDGDLDLVLTGSSSSGSISRIYRNNDQTPSTPPTSPTGLTSTWNADDTLTLQWDAATDAETASPGLTYNLRVGTTPGGSEICSAMALPSGRRTVARLGNVNHNTSWTLQVPIGSYYWSVQAVDPSFIGSPFATEQVVADPTDVPDFVPTRFALHAAVPNPFNPQTTLAYDLPRETRVTLVVYDLTGRRVRTLLVGAVEATGRHDVIWNGLDDGGRQVPSGVYCYRIEAGNFGATRRLTLLK